MGRLRASRNLEAARWLLKNTLAWTWRPASTEARRSKAWFTRLSAILSCVLSISFCNFGLPSAYCHERVRPDDSGGTAQQDGGQKAATTDRPGAPQPNEDNSKHSHTKFGDSLKGLKWDSAKGVSTEKSSRGSGRSASLPDHNKASGDTGASSDSIKLSTTLVALDVTVTDGSGSRIITGLTKNDFIVSQDGQPEQLGLFATGQSPEIPRRVVLLIDWSGSERAYLASSIAAAKTLVSLLAARDQMAIVTSDVQLICPLTADKGRLSSALDSLLIYSARAPKVITYPRNNTDYRGRSLQFTALLASLRELITAGDPRQIIIFQTDGDEAPTFRDQPQAGDFIWNMPDRPYGLADIYAAAQRRPATIYSVIPSRPLIGLSGQALFDSTRLMLEESERARFKTEADYHRYSVDHPLSDAKVKLYAESFASGQNAAAHVAEITGGWHEFLEKPEDASPIYSKILADIDSRFTLGFYPDNVDQSPKLHHIKVEVRGHPEYVVHGRDSYYSSAKN
jgi:VWFA-related protein